MPANLGDLAGRASTRGSVLRALDGLDRAALQTLDGLLVLGRTDRRSTTRRPCSVTRRRPQLAAALDRLRVAALAWGDDDAIVAVPTMRDVAGQYPAGLGRPAAALFPHQPARRWPRSSTGSAASRPASRDRRRGRGRGARGPGSRSSGVIGLDDEAREVLAAHDVGVARARRRRPAGSGWPSA